MNAPDFVLLLSLAAQFVLPFVVLITILVFVHEMGHYLAARAVGVHPIAFAVGMGPVLLSRTDRHGCSWQLRALPIGGFVKFVGDRDGSSASGVDDLRRQVPPSERRRYFALRGPGARAIVLFAGPAVNLLLGWLVLVGLFVAVGYATQPAVVADVDPAGPAAASGIVPGDRIVAIDGVEIERFIQVQDAVSLYPNATFTFEIERDGETRTLSVTTQPTTIESYGQTQVVGRIGIGGAPTRLERLGFIEAGRQSADMIWGLTKMMVVAIGQIVSGERSIDDMGGPVKIGAMASDAAATNVAAYVFLIAAISVSLGLTNLLPLPVLDGGGLVICAIEAVRRRPLSGRTMKWVNVSGLVMVGALFVTLTINDILSLLN